MLSCHPRNQLPKTSLWLNNTNNTNNIACFQLVVDADAPRYGQRLGWDVSMHGARLHLRAGKCLRATFFRCRGVLFGQARVQFVAGLELLSRLASPRPSERAIAPRARFPLPITLGALWLISFAGLTRTSAGAPTRTTGCPPWTLCSSGTTTTRPPSTTASAGCLPRSAARSSPPWASSRARWRTRPASELATSSDSGPQGSYSLWTAAETRARASRFWFRANYTCVRESDGQ